MKYAVVGLGLFGKSLAIHLARAGAEVIAVDSRLDLVDDIKPDVSVAVCLDATDERELRSQGIHDVDVLVASIGDNFESNQMLVMMAKRLGVPKVIARAPSEKHERILRLIGADEVVLPEEQAARELSKRLAQPSLKGYLALFEGYSVMEVEAPEAFQGKTLAELDLKRRHHVSVMATRRPSPDDPNQTIFNAIPLGSDRVEKGDVLFLVGRDEHIKALFPPPGQSA